MDLFETTHINLFFRRIKFLKIGLPIIWVLFVCLFLLAEGKRIKCVPLDGLLNLNEYTL